MSVVKFTATQLVGTGKRGQLTPDADGYYEMVVGGLNVFNSTNAYYPADGAKALFQGSTEFMRRVANGNLKGEVGHPKILPGQSMDSYMARAMSIEETNVCCFFKEIWLDENYGKNNPQFKNPNMIAIMGKLKPAGPKGPALATALADPDQNVCFSIRSLTNDYWQRGQKYRVLDSILTWDWVTEPGLALATKWNSPALESLQESILTERFLERIMRNEVPEMAMESSFGMVQEAIQRIQSAKPPVTKPPSYTRW